MNQWWVKKFSPDFNFLIFTTCTKHALLLLFFFFLYFIDAKRPMEIGGLETSKCFTGG